MSYDIHGDKGTYVAGGPSIGGLSDLKFSLSQVRQSVYPNVVSLLENGHCNNPVRLAFEFDALAKQLKNPDVKKTCLELAKASRKCKDIVILHNHNAN